MRPTRTLLVALVLAAGALAFALALTGSLLASVLAGVLVAGARDDPPFALACAEDLHGEVVADLGLIKDVEGQTPGHPPGLHRPGSFTPGPGRCTRLCACPP